MSVESLSDFFRQDTGDQLISFHNGQWIPRAQFIRDIKNRLSRYQQQSGADFALYHEATYPFAVDLFALLLAAKKVWIPGNNRPATAENLLRQGCRLIGEWAQYSEVPQLVDGVPEWNMSILDQGQLVIYTSGSTGQPKAIIKTVAQLEAEINVLEQCWGDKIKHAAIVATVSHQHIYGLLFKLLWPLMTERCFYSSLYLSPEALFKAVASQTCCWVASPAQLKRLDEQSPWPAIQMATAIFSSGGALAADVANKIHQYGRQSVIEVYGSSETGGIAWRQLCVDSLWRLLPGVQLKQVAQEITCFSPWTDGAVRLDDGIEWRNNGRFKLLGRRDEIVKIEEKRLSLAEMIQVLQQMAEVETARLMVLSGKRERLVAVIVLSPHGTVQLQRLERRGLIKRIREHLCHYFETVLLPRKWVFVNRLPETQQGKLDATLLRTLLNQDRLRYPLIQQIDFAGDAVRLQIRVQAALQYFDGHFPQQPILPGVTQLAWADYYGHLFFSIQRGFSRLEAVKFKKTIVPDTIVMLSLSWKAEAGTLYFDIENASDAFGSGRMVYDAIP